MKSRVLILGAGFGGMELATLLSEALGADADVTVIEKNDGFIFGSDKLDVMFGKKTPEAVRLPYRSFVKPGVRFVQDTITAIDPAARRVTTTGGTYEADFLVIALGAACDPSATPGLVESGNEFYSIPGAERVCETLPHFTKGRAIVGVCGFPYKCPPAPSECALTLHSYLLERGVRPNCEITLVSPLSTPVPVSADLSQALINAFEQAGINLLLNRTVLALKDGMAVLDDGSQLPYDLFLGIPKHKAPQVVIDSGIADGDWVPIDLATMETGVPCVYAIGDMAKTGLPKAGSFAESQASAVASGILSKIKGGEAQTNTGTGSCHVEFGDGRISWADADFLTGPKLQVVYNPPSLEGRKHKAEFGSSRTNRWFGL